MKMPRALSRAQSDVAAIEAEIAHIKDEGAAAVREAERLGAERVEASDFETAERIEREITRQRWNADHLAKRLPDLEARLVEARWQDKRKAFEKHRKLIAATGRKAIEAARALAEANAAVAQAREAARRDLGEPALSRLPLIAYLGIGMPDLMRPWFREAERMIEALDRAQLPPPPAPPPARPAPQTSAPPPFLDPRPGGVVLVGGVPNTPGQVSAEPPAKPPRQPRRDPPPGEGERQIFILRGLVALPGGELVGVGDRVNLPADDAERVVRGGAADFVEKV